MSYQERLQTIKNRTLLYNEEYSRGAPVRLAVLQLRLHCTALKSVLLVTYLDGLQAGILLPGPGMVQRWSSSPTFNNHYFYF